MLKCLKQFLKNKKIKKYESYSKAFNECSFNAYQNEELCDVVAQKTLHTKKSLENRCIQINNPNFFLLTAIFKVILEEGTSKINIIDFGGGGGISFYEVMSFFKERMEMKWFIVETPQMVKCATALNLHNKDLSFEIDIKDIKSDIDLFFSSGALQYVEFPYSYVLEIIAKQPKYILFTRMMLNENDSDIISVQKSRLSHNGPGRLPEKYVDKDVSYPHTTISYKKFISILLKNYEIEWEFDDKSGVFEIPGEKIIGKGYLFRRKVKI